MDPIQLDQDLARRLDQGMRSGEVIELPFPVIYTWALTGQANFKNMYQVAPALYYGGWACKKDDMDAVCDSSGLKPPAGWAEATIPTRDGKEFEAFTARSVIIAPFGKRLSWIGHDGKRSPDYIEGGRRHVQVLAYLAEKQGENGSGKYVPWGPVVLTAKGYQARNLMDAFSKWDKASAPTRRKIAPGVPAWCFYLALGTFGKERKAENVGKPGAQSPITPIAAYIPEQLTEEQIARLFVGDTVAAIMADLQEQAQEWLSAWSQPLDEAAGEGPQAPENFPGDPTYEDIPF